MVLESLITSFNFSTNTFPENIGPIIIWISPFPFETKREWYDMIGIKSDIKYHETNEVHIDFIQVYSISVVINKELRSSFSTLKSDTNRNSEPGTPERKNSI